MSTCKTCLYWCVPQPGAYAGPGEPLHDDIIFPLNDTTGRMVRSEAEEAGIYNFLVRQCTSPRLVFFERPAHIQGCAVTDASRYEAKLYTAERFGCVNHEPLDVEIC